MVSKRQNEFLVPYYFITLTDKKTIIEQKTDEKRYTGKLTCEITTRTPLFIPNTSSSKAFNINTPEHKSYDFYSYAELKDGEGEQCIHEPVIPGSEIRGMLRSVYEALTGSCMSIINDDALITNRMNPRNVFKPGMLYREGNTFTLIGAETALMKKEIAEAFYDGQKLYFNMKSNSRPYRVTGEPSSKYQKGYSKEGYLLKGMLYPKGIKNKKSTAIFIPQKQKIIAKYAEELQKKMQEVLSAYHEDSDSYKEYAQYYNAFMQGNGEEYFPVYYQKLKVNNTDETIIHISPAAITKKSYEHRVRDLVGELRPCNSTDKLCPACALFGMVNGTETKASKLRFSDARIMKQAVFKKEIALEELASPHISNAQMYLKRPSQFATEWNYDYWIERKDKETIVHKYKAELNGRKFYWHHDNPVLVKAEPTKRNVTVRPLDKENTFIEEIYFDNITKQQLQQLIYLCNISKDGKHGYKLGMGKSLGLGSIEMRTKNLVIRTFNLSSEDIYQETVIDLQSQKQEHDYLVSYEMAGFCTEKEIKKQFLTIMNFEIAKGRTISYPYTKTQIADNQMTEGFRWYTENNKKNAKEIQSLRSFNDRIGELPLLKANESKSNKSPNSVDNSKQWSKKR